MLKQLEELQAVLTKYLEARLDLFKLEARERVEEGITLAIYGLFLSFGFFSLLLLGQVLVAKLLSAWLGYPYAGYLLLLFFWVSILTLLWWFRASTLVFIRRILIRAVSARQTKNTDF
jgi:hypothetical protein